MRPPPPMLGMEFVEFMNYYEMNINFAAPPFPVGGYMTMQSGGPPQMSSGPNVMDQTMMPLPLMPVDEEPPNKKLRSEDNLIPEEDFISKHKVFV